MRKLNVLVFAFVGLYMPIAPMEKKIYTPQTMLKAIKRGDRELLIMHQKNYIPLKVYTLHALWNTKEASIRDAFFKHPITLSLELFNEFVEGINKNLEQKNKEEFSDFVHRLIGATGIIPTAGGFNELSLYKNKFVQWYLNEIKMGVLTPEEIRKLKQQLIIELNGYEKDLKDGAAKAYDIFYHLGFIRLKAIINDDDDDNNKKIKNTYFKKCGKELTFDVIKHFRPSGPLIVSLLIAIATGNTAVVAAIYSDFPELFTIKIDTADIYMQLLDACYKKVQFEDDLPHNNNQNNNQQQQILQSLEGITTTMGKITEFFVYDSFSVKAAVSVSVALRIAALYNRIEIAKYLLRYSSIHDDVTFNVMKDFMNWLSGIIKHLYDTSKIISSDEKEKMVIQKKQISCFVAMRKELKEYMYCLRRFEEIKKHTKLKFCALPLKDTSNKNIIVPADIGIKILEFCPLIYPSSKNNCLIS